MAETTQSTISEPRKQRILSIDVFRGLTITVMGFVNYAAMFEDVTPAWSQHAHDYGLTYVDLVAPFFYFAIALMMRKSVKSHIAKEGKIEAYFQQLKRYLTLMGMGFIGTLTFNEHLQVSFYMNTLSAIGLAGIICLFVITKPRIFRFILAVILMVVHQLVLLPLIGDYIVEESHAGFIGGIGWSIMLLYSTVIADELTEKNIKQMPIWGIISIVIGSALIYPYGISKHRVNVPYILVSIGLACIAFYLLWYLYDIKKITKGSSKFAQPQGKNSIFLFMTTSIIGGILGGLLLLLGDLVTWPLVLIVGFVGIVINWQIGVYLDKKKLYFVL